MTIKDSAAKAQEFFNKYSKKIIIVVITLLILCLAAAGTVWYLYTRTNDLVAVVGNERITVQDLNKKIYGRNMVGDPNDKNIAITSGISTDDKNKLIDALIEESIVRQYAAKNNITVTDEEALARAKADSKGYDDLLPANKAIVLDQAKKNVLSDKVSEKTVTWKKGQYIKIHFDKHFGIAESLSPDKQAALAKTQAVDIAADRIYADNLKDSIYASLTSGKITFSQAMDQVRNDKYIDYTSWDFTVGNPGVDFNTQGVSKEASLLENEAFKTVLTSTSKGEIAKPFVMKLDYGDWHKNEQKMIDSQWIILQVTDEHVGEATSYQSWIDQQKTSLKARKVKDGINILDLITGRVYAWSDSNCSAGRTNLGSNHPGDLITEARKINADGTNVSMSNAYSYVKTGSGAYAYTGCPLTGGFTINSTSGWEASEISGSDGCMYKFSSRGSFDLCCSGSHNPHKFAVAYSGARDATGHWAYYYQGTTDGSGWGSQSTSGFATGYGVQYSGSTSTFNITNGDTVYRRVYWVIDPPIAYTLVTSVASGSGSVSGARTYNSGTTAYPVASPSSGWGFSSWGGNCAGQGASASVLMNGNKNCSANFSQATYTLSTSVASGSGSVSGAGTYNSGTYAYPVATPSGGWSFSSWNGNCAGQGASAYVLMNGNKSCGANFTWINRPPTVTLVSPSLTCGMTSVTLEAYSVDDGNSQTMDFQLFGPSGSLVAESGWKAYVANNVHQTYTVSGLAAGTYRWRVQSFGGGLYSSWVENYFTTVNCAYTLFTNVASGSGSVSGAGPYTSGWTAYPVATPSGGWSFSSWSGDCAGQGASASVYMNGNKSCGANFSQITYTFTLSTSVASGSGSVSGAGTYNSGTTAYPVASPSSGWGFSSWGGNCAGQGPSASVLMNGNKSCGANFTWINRPPAVTLVSPVGNPTLGQTPTNVTLEAYSVDDGNSQTMDFQLYGPGGNLVQESGWTPYVSNYVHQTTLASSLGEGTYRWRVQSYDGSLYSAWVEAYFTITAPPVPHNLSCTVSPEVGGASPLVVKVTVFSQNVSGTYNYRMDAIKHPDEIQSGKPAIFYYTYSSPAKYQVQVFNSQVDPDPVLGLWRTCTPTSFEVKASTSASGGEVAR